MTGDRRCGSGRTVPETGLPHYRVLTALAVVFLGLSAIAADAALPGSAAVAGIDRQAVRDGYRQVVLHDYDSEEIFHPFFYESLKAVLGAVDSSCRMPERFAGADDTSAGYYIDRLRQLGVSVYRMTDLQGRILRVLVGNGIPVLLLGSDRNPYRGVTRVFADVLYAYRAPDYSQSSKTPAGELKYVFKTVRGFGLEGDDLHAPASRQAASIPAQKAQEDMDIWFKLKYEIEELRRRLAEESPLMAPPYDVFGSFCVITTPTLPLDALKKMINDGLGDVGFEYRLPEFGQLQGADIDR